MTPPHSGAWWTIALAAGIALVALFRGRFSPELGIALLFLILLGTAVPPLGILTAGLVLFYLIFIHGPELIDQALYSIGAGERAATGTNAVGVRAS